MNGPISGAAAVIFLIGWMLTLCSIATVFAIAETLADGLIEIGDRIAAFRHRRRQTHQRVVRRIEQLVMRWRLGWN